MKKRLLFICGCLLVIGAFLISKNASWKTYRDPTNNFEIRYPHTIVPDARTDGNFSTITFSDDIVVTIAPRVDVLPVDPGDVQTDSIRIDSYSASLFRTKYSNGAFSDGYKVIFQTKNHLYRIFVLDPSHAQRYLESFKVRQ